MTDLRAFQGSLLTLRTNVGEVHSHQLVRMSLQGFTNGEVHSHQIVRMVLRTPDDVAPPVAARRRNFMGFVP